MNIKDAKEIPLSRVLEQLACKPVKERKGETVYFSPWRVERTPSLHVHNGKNAWFDFGEGRGGDVIHFACAYLATQQKPHSTADALRWLANVRGKAPVSSYPPIQNLAKSEPSLFIKHTAPVTHKALVGYLAKRGIPLKFVTPYLVQLTVWNKDSQKSFFAVGLPNEDKGYEVRNPFFKGCVGTKSISFIRGTKPKPDGIHVFEGMLDFVSALAQRDVEALADDAIVLNSLSCLNQMLPYVKNYGYRTAFTWLDNDTAGEKATRTLADFFQTEEQLRHQPMNDLYREHKDVNAWRMSQRLAPK